MAFDFLKDLQERAKIGTTPVEAKERKARTGKKFNPTGMALRMFRDGRIFPSQELVTNFNLEYKNKKEVPGNAIDIFKSTAWVAWESKDVAVPLIAFPSKNDARTDLFGTSRHDDLTGDPLKSVLTQAPKTFKQEMEALLVSCFGKTLDTYDGKGDLIERGTLYNDRGFIDLVVGVEAKFEAPDGIYALPKVKTRGENVGEIVSLTRKGLNGVYPLIPAEMVENANTEDYAAGEAVATSSDESEGSDDEDEAVDNADQIGEDQE